jgi:hypothetical protein
VALEINANPARLDLDDVHTKRAIELGCLVTINTDAHHPEHFAFSHFGVGTARRGWAAAENVINAWPVEKLLQWLDERGHRRPRPVTGPLPHIAEPVPEAVKPVKTPKGAAAPRAGRKKTAAKKPPARRPVSRKAAQPVKKRKPARRRKA